MHPIQYLLKVSGWPDPAWAASPVLDPPKLLDNVRYDDREQLDRAALRQSWQFTEPRVEAVNAMARMHIAKFNSRHHISRKVRPIDIWELTAVRDDDPQSVGDMRHYGNGTYTAVLAEIWAMLAQAHGDAVGVRGTRGTGPVTTVLNSPVTGVVLLLLLAVGIHRMRCCLSARFSREVKVYG